jgi:hypothetical protein
MSRFSGYAFAKMSVRFTAAAALTVVTLLAQPQPGDTKEPIAYIGHGAMFDRPERNWRPRWRFYATLRPGTGLI